MGLYLYGSLTTGDFDPESSDIDLLAVTSSGVSGAEFEALRAMHLEFSRENPGTIRPPGGGAHHPHHPGGVRGVRPRLRCRLG